MSKGSPIVPVRFPEELLARINDQIAMTAMYSFDPKAAFGEWIRRAAEEKLAKMLRSRRPRRRRQNHVGGNDHEEPGGSEN